MHLIKKHACILAVLAALAASVAAPYLIPDNPDSPVFRNGALGALLLFACIHPAYHACRHADRRTLLCGAVWGYLFSAALGIGSELFFYNGLLEGFGSIIRRLAVPVLMTPLLGCLCAQMMLLHPADAPRRARRIPFAVFMGVIFLAWVPVLLAYWPGMINYDAIGEYMQHVESSYSSIHPLLHSALMNSVITLGEILHSPNFGMLMMSLLQMSLFSASLAYACSFAQKHGAPRWALLLMTAFFSLHPIFSVMSMSMTKDTLFAAAILALSLESFELLDAPQAYLSSKKRCGFFAFLTVNAALMRNNGIFALALLFPALMIALRGLRKQVLTLLAISAAASALTLGGLNLALTPESLPSFQFYSLPAQQLVRAYGSGKLSQEDMAELEGWYTSEYGLVVHPHLADGAKGYLDRPRIAQEGDQFLRLWMRNAGHCMHEYIEAFLMLNVGSWYPDDLSHSTIYPDASWNDKGYLQTAEHDMPEHGLYTTSLLPGVKAFYERICRRNEYQKYPIISILFCTATPFWVILFACFHLVSARRSRYVVCSLGALGLWVSYLFGPCTLPRYTLPLFCLAPVLLALSYCLKSSQPSDHP